MSVLADVILLGHGQVGSYALSTTKSDLFGYALTAFMDSIQQVLNRYAVPRLFKLNTFPEPNRLPQFKHGNVMVPDLRTLGQYIAHLARAGMSIFPDERIEGELLRVANLPPKLPGSGASKPPNPASDGTESEIQDSWDFDEFETRVVGMVENRLAALERMVRSLEAAGDES